MTKQEARRLVVHCAKWFKRSGFNADTFEEILKNRKIDDEVLEAYDLIKDEMVHVYAVVWGWDR